jgi:hypothetical protein
MTERARFLSRLAIITAVAAIGRVVYEVASRGQHRGDRCVQGLGTTPRLAFPHVDRSRRSPGVTTGRA